MSEPNKNTLRQQTFRWHLLGTVSAMALVASAPTAMAKADQPLLWVELGGDVDRVSDFADRFSPAFAAIDSPIFANGTPVDLQKPSSYLHGGEFDLIFQPENSDWVFSADIRESRSNNKHHVVTANEHPFDIVNFSGVLTSAVAIHTFSDARVNQSSKHLIIDFEVGRDVGLGAFGPDGKSVISAGVRVARFRTHSDVTARARPSYSTYNLVPPSFPFPSWFFPGFDFPSYYLHGSADRNFHGVGPSLSWKASTPLAGNVRDGELALDWSLNGALLFGRQSAKVSHETQGREFQQKYYHTTAHGYSTHYQLIYPTKHGTRNTSRNVTVPNLGASIGLTYRIENTKVSLGYRTDNFFGAMDGGIDKAKKTTLGFNGLYASISVGLGD